MRSRLIELTYKLTPDELFFVPFPDSWNVGQILLHIAEVEEGWFHYVLLGEYPRCSDNFHLEKYPTMTAILTALNEVHDKKLAYLGTINEQDVNESIETPWDTRVNPDKFLTITDILWIYFKAIPFEIQTMPGKSINFVPTFWFSYFFGIALA